MNFLKTLFWIVLTVVAVVFSLNNWLPIEIELWGGLVWETKKPLLMLIFFLIGLVPTLIYYRAKNWRVSRRLDTVERELADARGLQNFRAPERFAAGDGGAESSELTLDRPMPPGDQG